VSAVGRILAGAVAAAAVSVAAANQLGEASRRVLEGESQMRSIEITDEFASYVRRTTGSDSRVFADISAVKTYRQPGCKRLRIVIRAPDAVAVDPQTGQRNSFKFDYEMDLCADGSPPQVR
jgi:hypothetical protein